MLLNCSRGAPEIAPCYYVFPLHRAPDGTCLLSCSNDNMMRLYNLPTQLYSDPGSTQDLPEMVCSYVGMCMTTCLGLGGACGAGWWSQRFIIIEYYLWRSQLSMGTQYHWGGETNTTVSMTWAGDRKYQGHPPPSPLYETLPV